MHGFLQCALKSEKFDLMHEHQQPFEELKEQLARSLQLSKLTVEETLSLYLAVFNNVISIVYTRVRLEYNTSYSTSIRLSYDTHQWRSWSL